MWACILGVNSRVLIQPVREPTSSTLQARPTLNIASLCYYLQSSCLKPVQSSYNKKKKNYKTFQTFLVVLRFCVWLHSSAIIGTCGLEAAGLLNLEVRRGLPINLLAEAF